MQSLVICNCHNNILLNVLIDGYDRGPSYTSLPAVTALQAAAEKDWSEARRDVTKSLLPCSNSFFITLILYILFKTNICTNKSHKMSSMKVGKNEACSLPK